MELKAYAKTINESDRSMTAFASTGLIDRDGEIIAPEAFAKSIAQYRRNPVVLWAHDHTLPPVAKSLSEKITPEGLIFEPQFAPTREGKELWELYRNGFLNAFSVGFIPREFEWIETHGHKVKRYTEVELLEISAVPVPSNAGAVALRQAKAFSRLRDDLMCDAEELTLQARVLLRELQSGSEKLNGERFPSSRTYHIENQEDYQ